MRWRVEYTSRARRDLRRIDMAASARILSGVTRYAETGVGDARTMRPNPAADFRLRVGDWRVLFDKDAQNGALIIIRILHRRESYRR